MLLERDMFSLLRQFFGSANSRMLQNFDRVVSVINDMEADIAALSDEELAQQTQKLKQMLADGSTVDDVLPEAFATVREASKRVLSMRHFDVQLIGGMVLHKGMIAEMKTGEGKTVVATLAVYLNALVGKGVHVVTVNDYLAQRDAEWMGKLYRFLGLSVGCIHAAISESERYDAYQADITYGTNNEFGFDYLRDNMKFSLEERVQRPFHYAIVDEVDSILIDEARTPLIISGAAEDSSQLYVDMQKVITRVGPEYYEIDEKSKTITLTEEGTEYVEDVLKEVNLLEEGSSLYDIGSINLLHHVNQALKAQHLFAKDVDYLVKDDKVVIIDEFTGRMMEGRRFSEGLHQALEAKERVSIQHENQTLASITFQNYFRMYPKLAGMTGTALTEADEFADIYALEVVEVPTNIPVARVDENDQIYSSIEDKDRAIIELVTQCHAAKQPVLIGTVSIDRSEKLSRDLKKQKIPHHVLNARYHEQEAHIIAQAGRPGAVTIATNMAGRGTDIVLGGNVDMRIAVETQGLEGKTREKKVAQIVADMAKDKQAVLDAGGLFVIGTERHESRRIDNQLRGRSGRQGDPGNTRFFLSLEDDLMRIFGSDKIKSFLHKIGFKEGEVIDHPWISKSLEKAQQKVEARNYEIRKNLLKFDDVMNDQRKVIYEQRVDIMQSETVTDIAEDMREEVLDDLVAEHVPAKAYVEEWDIEGLEKEVYRIFGLSLSLQSLAEQDGVSEVEIREAVAKAADEVYQSKITKYGEELVLLAEKHVMLITLDQVWKEHLLALDHLRQGINLRAYGQKDPLNEYKREAFLMFDGMLHELREMVVARLAHLELGNGEDSEREAFEAYQRRASSRGTEGRIDPALEPDMPPEPVYTVEGRKRINPEDRVAEDPLSWGKVGRNELCPCGSGNKYKHCHGKE